jgi:two-component system sensor histidine kinase DevS
MSVVEAMKRREATALNYSPLPPSVYRPIARQALKLTGAELALVAIATNDGESTVMTADLVIVETAGAAMTFTPSQAIAVAGKSIGRAFVEQTPQRLDNFDVAIDDVERAGPALVLPLRTVGAVPGVLVVLRQAGAAKFSPEQLEMMAAFTDQAAHACVLGSAQHRLSELDILVERDRIARSLNDHVIQRIFAVGLALQGIISRARSSDVQRRLSGTIDDLQEAIQEINIAVFDLHVAHSGVTLRRRLDDAVAEFCGSELGTTVQFVGPLSVVDDALAVHVEAVVRKAISNAVRHVGATTLAVTVKVEDDVYIEVADNGLGDPADMAASGLTSLKHHAQQAGGVFTIADDPGRGTVLRWRAPLVC